MSRLKGFLIAVYVFCGIVAYGHYWNSNILKYEVEHARDPKLATPAEIVGTEAALSAIAWPIYLSVVLQGD